MCPQFLANGCENCAFFGMDGDRVRVGDCTTPNFQSLLSVVDPASSWAAKWQHLSEHLCFFCFVALRSNHCPCNPQLGPGGNKSAVCPLEMAGCQSVC